MSFKPFTYESNGLGLCLMSSPEVACYRHYSLSRESAGRWEVTAGLSAAALEVSGGYPMWLRVAVMDDFGSLVFVDQSSNGRPS
jgi:hypothetical protein